MVEYCSLLNEVLQFFADKVAKSSIFIYICGVKSKKIDIMKQKILLILMLLLPLSSMAQKVAYAVFKDSTLTFYYDDKKPEGAYDVENMVVDEYGKDVKEWGEVSEQIKTVVFDKSFKNCKPKSCNSWFAGCENLTFIEGIKINLNTSEVTDMENMFRDCKKLINLDVSGFSTDKVTDMHEMFYCCINLENLDVSGFNTKNVTNMWGMFQGCLKLTSLDVSRFYTYNVINMAYMFSECVTLTSLDVSGFKTDNVMNMEYMFSGCTNLTSLDVSGFITDNVINMEYMFYLSKKLTNLDVSGFYTYGVGSMEGMFAYCNDLNTIYVGDGWNTSGVLVTDYMFSGCTNLIGGQGTKYDKSHTDAKYAHIDGGKSNPGYFTKK